MTASGPGALAHDASREIVTLGFSDFAALGESRTYVELQAALQRVAEPGTDAAPTSASTSVSTSAEPPTTERRLLVMGDAIAIRTGSEITVVPPGNPQRLVGVIVANGGSVTIDQLSDALWPNEDLRDQPQPPAQRAAAAAPRRRRGRDAHVVPGCASSRRLACDFHDFQRLAVDSAGRGPRRPRPRRPVWPAMPWRSATRRLFVDFEYDEWAVSARRSAEQQQISLLDLLSVQAEDVGDFPKAQALAERALRLDRYTDSRYVRLAELLTLQNRVAAAIAVLDDAAEVARDMGGATGATKGRRDALVRRTATTTI